MLEMMKGYLQLAAGLGEMSRRKAMDAARDLVEGTPVAGLRTGSGSGPEALAAQVAAVADELMSIGRQNRRLLTQVVRAETEAVLASLGVGAERGAVPSGRSERLDDQLRALRDRVDDLERQLRGRSGGAGAVPSGTTKVAGKRVTPRSTKKTTKATASRATTGTIKGAAAKRAATGVTKATSKRATARSTSSTAKRTAGGTTTPAAGRRRSRGATS